jgi:hypothetical protein
MPTTPVLLLTSSVTELKNKLAGEVRFSISKLLEADDMPEKFKK